jgi:DNA-binding transcriptional LysR family regulator
VELRQIRYFIEIVRHGSVSAAARTLSMSQPPLSATLGALERELGVLLVERTARGVVPTEAGQLLFRRGEQIVREADQLAAELTRHGVGVLGSLRLMAYMPHLQTVLPRLLAAYRVAAPSVNIEIVELRADEALVGIEQGTVDVALMTTNDHDLSARMNRTSVHVEPIGDVELVAMLPPQSPWPASLSWNQLARHTIFAPPVSQRFPGLGNLVLAELARHADRRPDIRTVAQHQVAVAQVSAGLGVAVTVRGSVSASPDSPVTIRPLAQGRRTLTMELVWAKGRELPESVSRFISLVRALPTSAGTPPS